MVSVCKSQASFDIHKSQANFTQGMDWLWFCIPNYTQGTVCLRFTYSKPYTMVGSGGAPGAAPSPEGPNSFIFDIQILWKGSRVGSWRPLPTRWTPPYRKSWIRYWITIGNPKLRCNTMSILMEEIVPEWHPSPQGF